MRAKFASFAASLVALIVSFNPELIASASATEFPIWGGAGGRPFRTDCSRDYAVGIYVKAGAWIDGIGLICAPYDHASRKFKYPPRYRPFHGTGPGRSREALCQNHQYISAIRYDFTREGNNPKFLDFVEVTCTPLPGIGGRPLTICLETGHGCYDRHPNPNPRLMAPFWGLYRQECPANEMATGIKGRSGGSVDALGLICGRLSQQITQIQPVPTSPPRPRLGGTGGAKISVAKIDVDVFDSPVAPRKVIGIMRAGIQARVLEYHSHGWCKLDIPSPPIIGWVAQANITNCEAPLHPCEAARRARESNMTAAIIAALDAQCQRAQ